MSRNLAFKSFWCSYFRKARVTEVLASKTILKIYCKSFSEYLAAKDIARGFGIELRTKCFSRSENLLLKKLYRVDPGSGLAIYLIYLQSILESFQSTFKWSACLY